MGYLLLAIGIYGGAALELIQGYVCLAHGDVLASELINEPNDQHHALVEQDVEGVDRCIHFWNLVGGPVKIFDMIIYSAEIVDVWRELFRMAEIRNEISIEAKLKVLLYSERRILF